MQKIILVSTWILSAFLLFFNLNTLMPFIGDQAWFYISARNILINHTIPLVGITSSHIWLHQGPLWTYFLAVLFALFGFNPVIPGFVSAGITLATTVLTYFLGRKVFSEKTAFFGSLLFAVAPLVILNGRMPFCTVPIPLFVLLFIYYLAQFLQGDTKTLPLCLFILAILYNLEIATSVYSIIFFAIILFGILTRKQWIKNTNKPQILIRCILAVFFPMLPMFLYDMHHGFPQTVKYSAWLVLHVFSLFYPIHKFASPDTTIGQMVFFLGKSLQRMFFLPSLPSAIIIAVGAAIIFIFSFVRAYEHRRQMYILGIVTFVPILALIASKTPSEAYLPMIFIPICFFVGFGLDHIYKSTYYGKFFSYGIILALAISNTVFLLQNNYFIGKGGAGVPISERLDQAKQIIRIAQKKPYKLIAIGPGSQFSSFILNYQYLTWYLGYAASTSAKQTIMISDDGYNVHLLYASK